MSDTGHAPPIRDYALIGDCHGSALISGTASIDWCCQPRFDSGSCFGRLLDWQRGGSCSVSLDGELEPEGASAYLDDTLVLETTLSTTSSTVRFLDFFAMREHGAERPRRELVRIAECTRGTAEVTIDTSPRFDYGAIRPWLRRAGSEAFTAIGGDDGMLVWSDRGMHVDADSLVAAATLQTGARLRFVMRFVRPHELDDEAIATAPRAEEIDDRLDETLAWWKRWRERLRVEHPDRAGVVRSAVTLKALTYAPTGAILAASSASLPETLGGERNWDYRFSWIRDSTLAAHALAELGCEREAERSRHFIVRSSAGHAEDLQVLFGVGGERRTVEQELDLAGYRGARPVRIGNSAAGQLQLDAFGEILNLAWRWHRRGHSPDDDEWGFFSELVEATIERWRDPDRGIWEWRGGPRHFVHSKALCWAAVDRGLRLAEECMRQAPVRRWEAARKEIREAIESRGYDRERGVFVQCFDEHAMDAALLLLPVCGFVAFDDERMVRTADAVRDELEVEGLLRRYRQDDGLPGEEGAFLACSFWLAECYAHQGRLPDARRAFDRACATAGPLGLFSEQVDPRSGELLGNFPQALTHLSHISAAIALAQSGEDAAGDAQFERADAK
jgi:GH15 family glucan-1,4-alpha-glucosidase